MLKKLFLVACAALYFAPEVSLANDVNAGEKRYLQNCVNCHGKNGKGLASFPAILDRDANYISNRLTQYRAKEKVGPNSAIMMSLVGGLTDEEIANLAAYIEAAFGAPKAPPEPSGDAEAASAPSSSDRAAEGDFDARGALACAQEQNQAMGECAYGVARGGEGEAAIVVTFANGFKRTLYFADGAFAKADATMSGSGVDVEWRVEDGLHIIRVDDQRYELPDSAVFGG